jgi:hypothetical protein
MSDRRAFVKQLSGAGIISAIPDILLSQPKASHQDQICQR